MHLKFLQILGYKECGSQLNNCRANIKYLSGHCSWFSKPYGPISVGRFMISKIKHVHSVIAENVCKKKKKKIDPFEINGVNWAQMYTLT